MANENLSSSLSALLNDKVINEAFEIARSNRTGILQTVQFGQARVPFEGYKLSFEIEFDHPAVNQTGQRVEF
ncbi:MAG: hypothetical protein B7Z23_04570, partial [Pseudomonadales bacterium 32-61-5]